VARLALTAFAPVLGAAAAALTLVTAPAADSGATVNAKVVPPSMRAAVNVLRTRTRLPIIVPAAIDVSDVTGRRVFVELETATASAYTIDVDLAPGCYGVHACGYFSLSAAAPGAGQPHHRRVDLGRGVAGDLQPSALYAYPTDTVISWRLGTTAYTLSVNSHGPPALPLARAIVANLLGVPR